MMQPSFTRIAIERIRPGVYRVIAEPYPTRFWRRTFLGMGNQTFSKAVGYAVGLAVIGGCDMVDRTGRLSSEDCAALVAAQAEAA